MGYGDQDENLRELLLDQKRLTKSESRGVEIKRDEYLWRTLELGVPGGLVIPIQL